jgi:hypothetical protein
MDQTDKLWAALGKAIRGNASTKQVENILGRLNRARTQQR